MNKPLQNSTSWADTLKARKAYLAALLKTISGTSAKVSQIQMLTIKAIKAEMADIESQLIRRK
ncbi:MULTISPECIES: hypothetical protein [Pseudomonas]|uniref:hypothetical protein n=1 Tax=Pseudomonas TaxID=286 RepID=UPI0007300823|nr:MULTISPECIES: hypothetical protein [Pseudomonas]KTB73996.1 hypothetical protein AO068_02915 [Pseudomonas sp. ICMP 3272]KTC56709.1 hypothetical protein AO258_26670 [Pseudomonas syringae ICMP 19498]